MAGPTNFLTETYGADSNLWSCGRCLLNGLTYVVDSSTSGIYWGTVNDAWDPSTMGRCCPNDNVGAECLDGTNMWDAVNSKLSV